MNRYAVKRLAEAGYGDIEIHLNEWHTFPGKATRGTEKCCASATAMLLAMQNEKMDVMCYYDARMGISIYGGLFNPLTEEPYCTYYGFKAFGKLYKMGVQTECVSDTNGLYAIAATNENGDAKGLLIANVGAETTVETNLESGFKVYEIDEKHMFAESAFKREKLCFRQQQGSLPRKSIKLAQKSTETRLFPCFSLVIRHKSCHSTAESYQYQ